MIQTRLLPAKLARILGELDPEGKRTIRDRDTADVPSSLTMSDLEYLAAAVGLCTRRILVPMLLAWVRVSALKRLGCTLIDTGESLLATGRWRFPTKGLLLCWDASDFLRREGNSLLALYVGRAFLTLWLTLSASLTVFSEPHTSHTAHSTAKLRTGIQFIVKSTLREEGKKGKEKIKR